MKKLSFRQIFSSLTAGSIVFLIFAVLHAEKKTPPKKQIPFVQAKSPKEAGRYLILAAGCNDCHTPGWNESGSKLPEKQWLTGSPVGYKGPWGTTYASNLRLLVQNTDEKTWVAMLKMGKGNPPMPWQNYRYLNEKDTKALYAFIKNLGSSGKRMPDYVPPDKKPVTPYILMVPQQLSK